MEAYILDSLYRPIEVIEKYESLIWSERQAAYGDIQLKVYSTLENRNLFKEGIRIGQRDSYRVMEVKTVQDSVDDQGRNILMVQGYSLEEILDNRLARGSMDDSTTTPKWVLTGTPVEIATKMFHDICVTGILNSADIIPSVVEGSIFPADTVPAPPDSITYEVDPKTLYTAEKDICDLYHLGFRLVLDPSTRQLHFDIYTGSDRTAGQSDLPAVIFSPDLDNVKKPTQLSSTALYKNVAYVISPVGTEVVYALDIDPSTTGFERRVLVVKADDIRDEDSETASAKMIQRGIEELAKNRRVSAFDGEVNQNSKYKYGRDYNLGDLVTLRGSDGVSTIMQVTEQIFVDDMQGQRSYPTLSAQQFVTPGSWLAQPADKHWEDFTTEHWEDM